MPVVKDIGCTNEVCVESLKCKRTLIYQNGTARAVKRFGGNEDVGCGKFIPKKESK